MQLRNQKLAMEDFLRERADVMRTWPTGKDVDFEDGLSATAVASLGGEKFDEALEELTAVPIRLGRGKFVRRALGNQERGFNLGRQILNDGIDVGGEVGGRHG